MAKSSSLTDRVTRSARIRSDRERRLYVTARKALNPRATVTRRAAARRLDTPAFEIPHDRGYVLFEPGRFPEAEEVAAAAREQLAQTPAERLEKANKEFMVPILDQSALTADSPFLRFALRDDIVAAVTSYLGVAPVLAGINVYNSQSPRAGKLKSSQLLHCDGDDTKQVKVFVLCSEVTAENGPTMVMDAERSAQIRRSVAYQYRNRVADDKAREVLGGDLGMDVVTGRPGTVALVDTSRCFHFGSRVEPDAQSRLAAIVQYLTPHSFMLPRDPRQKAPFRHLATDEDSRLRRLVLGAA